MQNKVYVGALEIVVRVPLSCPPLLLWSDVSRDTEIT